MRLSDRSNPSPDFIGDKSTFLTIQITIKVTDALLQGIAAFCEGFGIGYSQRKFRGTIWLIVQLWQFACEFIALEDAGLNGIMYNKFTFRYAAFKHGKVV